MKITRPKSQTFFRPQWSRFPHHFHQPFSSLKNNKISAHIFVFDFISACIMYISIQFSNVIVNCLHSLGWLALVDILIPCMSPISFFKAYASENHKINLREISTFVFSHLKTCLVIVIVIVLICWYDLFLCD